MASYGFIELVPLGETCQNAMVPTVLFPAGSIAGVKQESGMESSARLRSLADVEDRIDLSSI